MSIFFHNFAKNLYYKAEITMCQVRIKNYQSDIENLNKKINTETETIKELKRELNKIAKENEH